jgi:hypothetical protein
MIDTPNSSARDFRSVETQNCQQRDAKKQCENEAAEID